MGTGRLWGCKLGVPPSRGGPPFVQHLGHAHEEVERVVSLVALGGRGVQGPPVVPGVVHDAVVQVVHAGGHPQQRSQDQGGDEIQQPVPCMWKVGSVGEAGDSQQMSDEASE